MAELLEQRKTLHGQLKEIEERCQALEEAVTQLQPLANLGMFWAMTAHELNNLLTPVISYSQLALQNPQDAALSEKAANKTVLLGERARAILQKIMGLAGDKPLQKQSYPLNQMLDDVFVCIGRDFKKDRIQVTRQVPETVEVVADAVAIQQVLMNLILNARDAMLENGGRLTIRAEATPDGTQIEISDTGCGIEPATLKKIFTPFYTAGKDGGNGLGLAFCQRVIEAHGGFITADSTPGRGTHFKILLPKYTL